MNENHIREEKKDASKANLRVAIILGLIALAVASMPFFYLRDQVL